MADVKDFMSDEAREAMKKAYTDAADLVLDLYDLVETGKIPPARNELEALQRAASMISIIKAVV